MSNWGSLNRCTLFALHTYVLSQLLQAGLFTSMETVSDSQGVGGLWVELESDS